MSTAAEAVLFLQWPLVDIVAAAAVDDDVRGSSVRQKRRGPVVHVALTM